MSDFRLPAGVFTAALFLFTASLFAQSSDKSKHALLWEITGKTLTAPSYLFGTMHVQDERAFELTDSTVYALDAVNAFAMEVHPDSILREIATETLTGKDEKNTLKEDLSPEAYEKLQVAFYEKTGMQLDSFEQESAQSIGAKFREFTEPAYTKKRETILDMYLYHSALRKNKALYGLEEMPDYDNVADKFFAMFEKKEEINFKYDKKQKERFYERMIELYRAGDLEEIMDFSENSEEDEDYREAMLDTRNVKMTDNILRLAEKEKSIFAAVGTAHLPGEEGIINLLRRRGYTLRRVQPTFTGAAEKLEKINETPLPWRTFTVGKSEISLPTTPVLFMQEKFPDDENIDEMKVYAAVNYAKDGELFLLSAIEANFPVENVPLDKLKNFIEMNNSDEGFKVVGKIKEVANRNGLKGIRAEVKGKKGIRQQRQVFAAGNTFYLQFYIKDKKADKSAQVDSFFDSFYLPDYVKLAATDYFGVTHTDTEGAYRVSFPKEPKSKIIQADKQTQEGETVQITSLQDYTLGGGQTFIAEHSSQPVGRTVENDREIIETHFSKIRNAYNITKPIEFTTVGGYPAGRLNDTLDNGSIYSQVIQRGTRTYFLLAAVDPGQNLEVEPFFDSFTLLPFEFSEKEIYNPVGEIYEVAVPENREESMVLSTEDDGTYGTHTLMAYDSLNGITYSVTRYEYGRYFESDTDDKLNEFFNNSLTEGGYRKLRAEEKDGRVYTYWDLSTAESVCHNLACTFFAGNSVYELNVLLPSKNEIGQADAFFRSFTLTENPPLDYLAKSKAELLLSDLISADENRYAGAVTAVNDYSFTPDALPFIYDYLENKKFRRDTVEELLLREFLYNRDARTVDFLRDYFTKTESTDAQGYVLSGLAATRSEAGLDAFFALSKNWQKDEEEVLFNYKNHFAPFDSLEIFNARIDDLIELYPNPQFSYKVAAAFMTQVNAENEALILPHRDLFFAEAKRIAAENELFTDPEASKSFDDYYLFDALNLVLADIEPTPEIEEYFKSFHKLGDAYLTLAAIRYYANQQIPFNQDMAETLQNSPYDVLYLYRYAFDAFGSTEVLPEGYGSTENVVKAVAYKYLSDEYGNLAAYEVIKKEKYNYAGEDLILHIFTFELQDYDGKYMGVVSQPATGKPNPYPTLYDYSNENWENGKTQELMRGLKESWEAED